MSAFDDQLKQALAQRQVEQRYRQRSISRSPQAAHVDIDGRSYLAFCSNDYLGLANHPSLISSFQDAAKNFGVGSGASHLVIGHQPMGLMVLDRLMIQMKYHR